MREQDWVTSYWFYGQPDLARGSVINANRHLAGMLGFVRIADKAGDNQAEALGFALLAKAAVTRIGMALYPRYLYSAGLVELPNQANWHPALSAGRWRGHLFNSDWTGAYDDARQVTILDQHEVYLYDHSGYMRQEYDSYEFVRLTSAHLTGYRDLVPETARLLSDHAKADVEIYADKFEAHLPHWYAAFAEATLGMEHNLTHPADSFQVFMAKAWIQHTSAPVLGRYLDIPWLEAGDLFYMQKLAETIKAYRGTDWEDSLILSVTPGDRALRLNWESHQNFAAGTTWRIEYAGPRGDQASPITGIPIATRSYTLTGLTNYAWYTLTLSAMSGNTVVASAPAVTAMPTNRFTHIPLLKQSR